MSGLQTKRIIASAISVRGFCLHRLHRYTVTYAVYTGYTGSTGYSVTTVTSVTNATSVSVHPAVSHVTSVSA